jgi:acyl-CoA dehydrogenase
MFRTSVQRFIEREIAPYHEQWEEAGVLDRSVWRKAGEQGLLLITAPVEYGGGGGDFLMVNIFSEELVKGAFSGPGFRVHSDIVAPYLVNIGNEEQKRKWLPKMASGELIGAIAMTEPSAGSDLKTLRTTAVRDGDEYVINGQKTFITNGALADLFVVAVKTDPRADSKGVSLIVVEAERSGFERGRKLKKIGLKAQDTAELFFNDVRVPASNLLGEEGKGFRYLMEELPRERLLTASIAQLSAERAVELTCEYVKERQAFGGPLMALQNTRFVLAEAKTEVMAGRAFMDECINLFIEGNLDAPRAAMVKLWTSEMEGRVIDKCLQLFGGWGYMWEYPIARFYADARVHRIYAGSSEIMKEIIARSLEKA